jgi:DNA-binding IclR family transcriptional regulator
LARGASAKVLLAFMGEAQRTAAIGAHIHEAGARQALEAELAAIRARGFAESEGEVDAAIWGVSAPVLTASGRLEAALTLMAPADRARPRRERLVTLTREAAQRIGRGLRGGPELEEAAA